jgi:hypothetical protein
VVDEPTDLPEGTEVELAAVDDEAWDLSAEQRDELKARIAGADRGELVPAAEVFDRLRGTPPLHLTTADQALLEKAAHRTLR